MKRLTLTLWSCVLLFLGIGTAWAQVPATPTFSSEAGAVWTGAKVAITCETEGATIYYTEDGSQPTAESTEYTASIVINAAKTLKAIAIKDGQTSEVAEAAYTVKTPAAPVLTPASGAVEEGASIDFTLPEDCAMEMMVYYVYVFNNDNVQLENLTFEQVSTVLMGEALEGDLSAVQVTSVSPWGGVMPASIPVGVTGEYKMRVRMAVGLMDPADYDVLPTLLYSEETTATYTVSAATPASKPTFIPEAGEVAYNTGLALVIEASDEDLDNGIYAIYYVLDDANFDFKSYTTDVDIDETDVKMAQINQKGVTADDAINSEKLTKATTIRAAACKRAYAADGSATLYAWSEVAEASYTITPPATPEFSSEAGAVWIGAKVAITCETEGAKIYYTVDGSTPTTSSTEYTASVAIGANMTLKAIAAFGEGENAVMSEVAEAAYTVKTPATPTFTPSAGTLEQGASIDFTLPDDCAMEPMVFFIYVFNDETVQLQNITYEQLNAIMGGEAPEDLSAVQISMVMPGWDGVSVMPATIPVDATGEVKMRVRMLVGLMDPVDFMADPELLYSDEATATYTVTAATPVPKPTFNMAEGAVAYNTGLALLLDITDEEMENSDYAIYYVFDKPDVDFKSYTTDAALEEAGAEIAMLNQASSEYEPTNFTRLTKATTIRAAACKRVSAMDGSYTLYAWSEVAEASYTIKAEKPTFDPAAGAVAKGTNLTWTWDESYADKFDQVGVIYVAEGTDADLNMTATEIMQAYQDTPEDATREDGTVYVYTEEDDYGYTIDTAVTVKARFFAMMLDPNYDPETDEDGEPGDEDMILIFSDIETAAYTLNGQVVDPEPAIATPVITPGSGEVEKGQEVTITCATTGAYIMYTLDGTTPTMASAVYREGTPIVINEALTLKAAAAVQGKWSEVATAVYTIKGSTADTVATPTFNPAGGEVAKGAKVEIACATDSVKIYYTIDGSEPTAESTEYTSAIEINAALTIKAIAIKGEAKSAVAEASYTIKEVGNEGLELSGVSVYPNPSDGVFTLDLPVAARVEVYGLTGVMVQRFEAGAGLLTMNIDHSGIYFLRITAEGRTTVKRVVVR